MCDGPIEVVSEHVNSSNDRLAPQAAIRATLSKTRPAGGAAQQLISHRKQARFDADMLAHIYFRSGIDYRWRSV